MESGIQSLRDDLAQRHPLDQPNKESFLRFVWGRAGLEAVSRKLMPGQACGIPLITGF